MIIGSRFQGDIWHRVMGFQHDLYSRLVAYLFEAARTVYLRAEAVLGLTTVPGMLAAPENAVDHRVLQELHDLIAAKFRYTYEDHLHPHLPFPGWENDQARIENLWRTFYFAEVDRLVSESPTFVRSVVVAIAFQNTEVGYAAEERARARLLDEYPMLAKANRTPPADDPGFAYPGKAESP